MIYCVEDERNIRELLVYTLGTTGFQAKGLSDGKELFAALEKEIPELVLLDIMLPGEDGYAILEKLKKEHRTRDIPVIMVTAKEAEYDKVRGLDGGADDYITKPFNPLELVARVKAQLRRYKKYNPSQENVNVIDFKGLIIDNDSHRCTLYDEVLNLTPIEFSILWYLCKNRGRVITSEELFEAVWKEKYFDSNNTVMVHIRRLREKMHEPPRNPKFIKTVWGVGYQIEE